MKIEGNYYYFYIKRLVVSSTILQCGQYDEGLRGLEKKRWSVTAITV